MRQHRLLCSYQLLSCLISLMKPIPPKQSEEIKCPIYFGLQEMWTPAFLGLLGKMPNQSSSFFNFDTKHCKTTIKPLSPAPTLQNKISSLERVRSSLPVKPLHCSTPQDMAPPCLAASPLLAAGNLLCLFSHLQPCAGEALQRTAPERFRETQGSIWGEISPTDPRWFSPAGTH